MPHPDGILAIASSVAAVLRVRLHCLRRSARGRRAPVEAPRLDPAREWEMVVGLLARDLSRVSGIAAIHAHAALKIDAAEHALGRIAADCAKLLAPAAAAALRSAPRLVHRPEPPRRLAA